MAGYNYPDEQSRVTVTFRETGEVKEYGISAGPGIAGYLCEQATRTGFLTLRDGDRAVNIPIGEILTWEMERVRVIEPENEGRV